MSERKADYVIEAMEMMGIDLDAPKQIIQEVSGFTPLFDVVVNEYHDETRAAVHGVVWRFCQMADGVCKASLDTIAEFIGVTKATVLRHIEILVSDGYFIDLTPDLRNRPHVYADTGKVIMKSKLTAGVAQKNVTVAQKNVTVAQSQLSKDIKKDIEEKGANAPKLSSLPIEWQIASGTEQITMTDQTQAQRRDAAMLIATGFGANTQAAYELAFTFQNERNITFTESDIKGQRKAIKALLEKKVQPVHVQEAVRKLIDARMTFTDLFGVMKTAVDIATKAIEPVEMTRLL